MKNTIFRGIGTALITPMKENGAVDLDAMGNLIDWQLECGIDAFIVCATTGEAPTLADDEHIDTIKFAVKRVAGRVPIIAGTGSNYTEHAVEMSKEAANAGADALLCVTPYYNKCTQQGLVENYYRIADSTELPMIVYNVPGRTGVNIKPDTYARLAEHDCIVAIKEANGNIGEIVETMSKVTGKLDLYSGNDDQIVPLMSMGGIGCISVFSNMMPREAKMITDRFFAGDVKGAAEIQMKYKALIDALFCEVNPIPVKAALAAMGICGETMRLPLTPMGEENRKKLLSLMKEAGLPV